MTKNIKLKEALVTLDRKLFSVTTLKEVNDQLDKMFTQWISYEFSEDPSENCATMLAYYQLKKLLAAIETKQDPEEIKTFNVLAQFA